MKNFLFSLVLISSLNVAMAEVKPGMAAPDFILKDMTGADRKLSDFKGKFVVLEWFNKDCPYVKKHYSSNNMQDLQKKYTGKGVVWLSMYSSSKGKQGYEEPAEALKTIKDLKASSTHQLSDASGKVGTMYGAKTTPHMYIINPEQKVIYVGAIDDNSSSDSKDIPKSKNYVSTALDLAMSGKPVEVQNTKPYGCGVKY
jgi:peroxiredoxin